MHYLLELYINNKKVEERVKYRQYFTLEQYRNIRKRCIKLEEKSIKTLRDFLYSKEVKLILKRDDRKLSEFTFYIKKKKDVTLSELAPNKTSSHIDETY